MALRLFRILDKRFHGRDVTKVDLRKLCIGKLGLSANYSPSQMIRVLDRAAAWLIECGYLRVVRYKEGRDGRSCQVIFKQTGGRRRSEPAAQKQSRVQEKEEATADSQREDERSWFTRFSDEELLAAEAEAVAREFGNELERQRVRDGRQEGLPVRDSGKIRRDFVRRYVEWCRRRAAGGEMENCG